MKIKDNGVLWDLCQSIGCLKETNLLESIWDYDEDYR